MSSKDAPLNGVHWLTEAYDKKAEVVKTTSSMHTNQNRKLVLGEDVWLKFQLYGRISDHHPLTGRVIGTKHGAIKDEFEVILVPKGTEVFFYRRAADAAKGMSVATFFIPGEQVTYLPLQNLRRVRV